MKPPSTSWLKAVLFAPLGFFLACSVNDSTPIPEAEYPTKIVGCWQGSVGETKETMSLAGDRTFVCKLEPTGFIDSMVFPREPGTVSGTWKIAGTILTLGITGEKNERVMNQSTTSTIVAFMTDKLVLKSDHDGTSSFRRVDKL